MLSAISQALTNDFRFWTRFNAIEAVYTPTKFIRLIRKDHSKIVIGIDGLGYSVRTGDAESVWCRCDIAATVEVVMTCGIHTIA